MRGFLGVVLTTAMGCTVGEIDGTDDDDSRRSTLAPPPPETPSQSGASTAPTDPAASPDGAPELQTPAHVAAVTYYWVAERPADDPDELSILDCDGAVLTRASKEFEAEVEMQRTARAISPAGKRITFNDVGGCFRTLTSQYPWGIGVTSPTEGPYALVPFRSIAVDPSLFTLGKWYFVRELVGKTTPRPSVFIHDGCVRAVDVGGAIKGDHIDFFVGNQSARASFTMDEATLEDGAAHGCGGPV
jgi:3D (Asp-Asp-Asp) domain-containing protein